MKTNCNLLPFQLSFNDMMHRLILLIVVLGSIFCFGTSYAQVSSAAFDPNCYFPQIGVPGEIDTIYGHTDQVLGDGMLNLGPNPNNTFGRLSCTLVDTTPTSVFKSWPSFNLHKLQIIGKFDLLGNCASYRFGHYHSPKYKDLLCYMGGVPSRIYWQNDNGDYDSSIYTELWSQKRGSSATDFSQMAPYSAHISSDTVEDIVYSVFLLDKGESRFSGYLIYFKGGEQLKAQGKIAQSDSMFSIDTFTSFHTLVQGDFRGEGREDLIMADDSGNMTFFKNDPPFSMTKFLNAVRYDTIFTQWENRKALNGMEAMAMSALSKNVGDSSSDLLASFVTNYGARSIQEFRIFRGGKDFGSYRWTADSAAFILHEPYYYDANYHDMTFGYGGAVRDCGKMTGTQNHVLYIEGLLDGGFYGYNYFYMLGNAISDKVAMFIGPLDNHGGTSGAVDTIVADNDKLQDIIMGMGAYGMNNGNEANGTIYVVHGSLKIPEITRNVSSPRTGMPTIIAYPNPITEGKCMIDLSGIDQQDLQITIWDLLGRKVYSEFIYAPFMRPSHPISINSVPSGTYILEITGKNFNQRIQLSVLK